MSIFTPMFTTEERDRYHVSTIPFDRFTATPTNYGRTGIAAHHSDRLCPYFWRLLRETSAAWLQAYYIPLRLLAPGLVGYSFNFSSTPSVASLTASRIPESRIPDPALCDQAQFSFQTLTSAWFSIITTYTISSIVMTVATTAQAQGHIVLFAHEAWSHSRPVCVLATRIALARNIYVTLIVIREHWKRANVELSRGFDPEVADRRKFIRLVGISTAGDEGRSFLDGEESNQNAYFAAFENIYAKLADGKAISDDVTNEEVPAVMAPSVVVMDP
ncbi:hypothetical protein EIP91_001902 [Steccherinum ochraceum]|uniref:Uncharacterized protein n=1 Tax=Steccherinum ochraceum TaxID=92696 RepID=A0A4R0RFD5_9APHY|nr:hypothetical protein EIP91_001902 [Steccherinum ochraceum]